MKNTFKRMGIVVLITMVISFAATAVGFTFKEFHKPTVELTRFEKFKVAVGLMEIEKPSEYNFMANEADPFSIVPAEKKPKPKMSQKIKMYLGEKLDSTMTASSNLWNKTKTYSVDIWNSTIKLPGKAWSKVKTTYGNMCDRTHDSKEGFLSSK